MNKQEILNMPAGRELDALVAEKVIGLEVYRTPEEYIRSGMPHGGNYNTRIEHPAYYHPKFQDAHVLPDYSTDIKDALDAVETHDEYYIEKKDGEYFVMVGDSLDWCVNAKTLPEAICKALLLAVI